MIVMISCDEAVTSATQELAALYQNEKILRFKKNCFKDLKEDKRITFIGHGSREGFGEKSLSPEEFVAKLMEYKLPESITTIDLLGCEMGEVFQGISYGHEVARIFYQSYPQYSHIRFNFFNNLSLDKDYVALREHNDNGFVIYTGVPVEKAGEYRAKIDEELKKELTKLDTEFEAELDQERPGFIKGSYSELKETTGELKQKLVKTEERILQLKRQLSEKKAEVEQKQKENTNKTSKITVEVVEMKRLEIEIAEEEEAIDNQKKKIADLIKKKKSEMRYLFLLGERTNFVYDQINDPFFVEISRTPNVREYFDKNFEFQVTKDKITLPRYFFELQEKLKENKESKEKDKDLESFSQLKKAVFKSEFPFEEIAGVMKADPETFSKHTVECMFSVAAVNNHPSIVKVLMEQLIAKFLASPVDGVLHQQSLNLLKKVVIDGANPVLLLELKALDQNKLLEPMKKILEFNIAPDQLAWLINQIVTVNKLIGKTSTIKPISVDQKLPDSVKFFTLVRLLRKCQHHLSFSPAFPNGIKFFAASPQEWQVANALQLLLKEIEKAIKANPIFEDISLNLPQRPTEPFDKFPDPFPYGVSQLPKIS